MLQGPQSNAWGYSASDRPGATLVGYATPIMPTPNEHRVLTIQQSWAWAIGARHKRVENRSWGTSYRGTLFIHASKARKRSTDEQLEGILGRRAPEDLPTGAIVAVCTLADIVSGKDGRQFGKWFVGPMGLVLTAVRKLKRPVPMKGKLGLWKLTPSQLAAVKRQL